MPRRPKFRGKATLDVRECPTCGCLLTPQIKADFTGKEYVCSKCDKQRESNKMIFELNKEYRHSAIEGALLDGFFLDDMGPFQEGLNFQVIREGEEIDPGDAIASFVLTGTAGGEGVYRCCYLSLSYG